MKKIAFVVAICMLVATPVLADIKIQVNDDIGSTNGGAFKITVKSDSDPFAGYSPGDTFQTFCIETGEFLSLGGTYYVKLNTKAVMGGNPPAGDPLGDQAAWVYTQWLDVLDKTVVANANNVQNAIWYLEGEVGGVNNLLALNAAAAVAGGWTNKNIRVMNLYGDAAYTQLKQDLLVRVPVPGTFLLGALGLVALGRKLRQLV